MNPRVLMHATSRPAVTRTLAAAAMACLLVTGSPSRVSAQQSEPTVMVVNTEATFLRDAPNVRSTVLTRLERGDRVEVLDRSHPEWWRVRAGDPPREGYVHRLVLSDRASVAPPPRPLPRPAPAEPEPVEQPADADDVAAPGKRGPGGLVFGGVGWFLPTARDTFDAVGITGNPLTYGGGFEAARVYGGLFLRAAIDWTSETGERVFLSESGERFPLGIPLDVEMMPIDFSAGWRFEGRGGGAQRVVPYAGGGAGILRYRETDPFADESEEVDERFASYHVLAGADVYVSRLVAVRAEYRFRAVPDALGDGGVSAVTGDTSLGGSVFFVGIAVGR